jgi:uncharacterized protein
MTQPIPVEFKSEGVTCRADLYLPEGTGPFPTVVMGGGWCYVKELIQPEYARVFNAAGLAALVFDYRHLGSSDGEPRQHINPWAQVEDYRNAISFAETRPEVDADRIGVWGISYSGSHAIVVGSLDRRVKAVCSVVPMVNGLYNARRSMSNVGFQDFMRVIEEDRRKRFATGEHGRILHSAHPHEAVSSFPSPDTWPVFKRFKETVAPLHEHWTTVQSAELYLSYDIKPYCERIVSTPVLMVTAKDDDITMTEIEVPYFNAIPCTTKKMVQIGDGASHMSIYDNDDHLNEASVACRDWLAEHLRAGS